MKRVVLSVTGTVLGIVALLSFKTNGHPVTVAGGLPSASLPTSTAPAPTATSAAAVPATTSGSGSTPPDPTTKATSAAATTTKRYVGSSIETRYGVVQVAVTAQGTHITNVSFVQLTAFDGHSAEINSQAGPILLQETLSAQSAQIDTVSGATYTTDGYVQSLQSALDRAGIG